MWAFSSIGYASNWHPMTWISHELDIELFGINPGMHHLTNVIFHIFNTILLFIILERMTGALWRSAVVAALFALHPLHVESVAWVSERKDMLSTFFWMLTMAAYLHYTKQQSMQRYLLMIIAYIFGLLSKPMLVTLPFVLLLMDFWPLRRLEDKTTSSGKMHYRNKIHANKVFIVIGEKIPMIVLAAISSYMTFYAQKSYGAVVTQDMIPLPIRIINGVSSYVSYLEKMVWPLNLAAYYPYPISFNPITIIACIFVLLLFSALAFRFIKVLPYITVGWLWYLGTLFPVIGIMQVGNQSMADRYTYIPLIGIFLIISWGLSDLLKYFHAGEIAFIRSFTFILLLLMGITWTQVGYWKNSETLFRHAVNITGNNWFAECDLACSLSDKGDRDGAIEHFKKAVQVRPYDEATHKNLGNVLFLNGNLDDAIDHYLAALKINPDDCEIYYNLGNAYQKKSNLLKALEYFELTLNKNPGHIKAEEKISAVREDLVKLQYIAQSIQWSIQKKPNDSQLYISLGDIYKQQGKYDEAIAQYSKAVSIHPESIKALYGLASAYSDEHEFTEALNTLQKMMQMGSSNPEIYYNIACIYARQNNTDKAIEWLKQAIEKGFNNYEMIKKDPDLINIRNTAFMNNLPKYQ